LYHKEKQVNDLLLIVFRVWYWLIIEWQFCMVIICTWQHISEIDVIFAV